MRWSLWKWNLQMSFYIHVWDKQLALVSWLLFFTSLQIFYLLNMVMVKWLTRKSIVLVSSCLLFVESWLMSWWEKYLYLDFGEMINDTTATHDTNASGLGLLLLQKSIWVYDTICSSGLYKPSAVRRWSVCASPVCQLASVALPIFLWLAAALPPDPICWWYFNFPCFFYWWCG